MTRSPHSGLRVEPLEDRTTPVALDPAFGTNSVVDDVPTGTALGTVPISPAAIQADGSTLLADARGNYDFASDTLSYAVHLIRVGPAGQIDPTFGLAGVADTPIPVAFPGLDHTLIEAPPLVLTSGHILVPLLSGGTDGVTPSTSTAGMRVARFTPNGALDTAYGVGGVAELPATGERPTTGLRGGFTDRFLIQPDGGVVVIGLRTGGQVLATRLTPNGQPDAAFGTRLIDLGPGDAPVPFDAAVTADGKIVVAGTVRRPSQNPGSLNGFISVVTRLNADGSPDESFGLHGEVRLQQSRDTDFDNLVRVVSLQPDGGVLLAGTADLLSPTGSRTDRLVVLTRLDSAGRLDSTFGGDGQLTLRLDDPTKSIDVQAILLRPDGRALVVGSQFQSGEQVKFFQVTADGRLDATFGVNGTAALNPRGESVPSYNVVAAGLTADGRLVTKLRHTGNPPFDSLAAFIVDAPTLPEARGVGLSEYTPPNADIPPFGGESQTTQADLTGDGRTDTVTYGRVGNEPRVRVIDGDTGTVLVDQLVFEPSFTGGILAAIADLDGDGRAELAVAPDVGGGARVQVFTVAAGGLVQRDNFFAIEDLDFRGGARLAAGDLDGDGAAELLVGAGVGGGPRVAVYRGRGLLRHASAPEKLIPDFFAFPGPDTVTLRDGVFPAAGDLTGDGRADVAFGGGPGGAPRVMVLDGALVAANRIAAAQAGPVANFFAGGNTTARGGVQVAIADVDADTRPELAAYTPDLPPAEWVKVYTAADVRASAGREPATVPTPTQLDTAAALFGVRVT